MDLPDFRLAVINTTREARAGLSLRSRVVSLDNRVLLERTDRVTAKANGVTALAPLDLRSLLEKERLVLVSLTLDDSRGHTISSNTYWQAKDDADHQKLNALPAQALRLRAQLRSGPDERVISVDVANDGRTPALAAKLTLIDDKGERILPALYSDNYITLLPGEHRQIEIRYPTAFAATPHLALRGWNITPASMDVRGSPEDAPETRPRRSQ
jgi:hypothetical protein